jgi:DNA polymerase I-like protein with 3'-5' exonuclease and polymerase domains
MRHIAALDIETTGLKPYEDEITSWVLYDGSENRFITSDDRLSYVALFRILSRFDAVFCHNAIFDVAFLSKKIEVSRIKWYDTLLLARWIENSNSRPEPKSLVDLVNRYEILDVEAFTEMKARGIYDMERNKDDALYTYHLAKKLLQLLPEDQLGGMQTEASCISEVAKSWALGIDVDSTKVDEVNGTIDAEIKRLEEEIVIQSAGHLTEKSIRSPKQLGIYLFDHKGYKVTKKTATGGASTDVEVLKTLAAEYQDECLSKVIELKTYYTLRSKYLAELPSKLYSQPNIFGTYTGRFTYASKIGKERTSIALHQLPSRSKAIRSLLIAPPGYTLFEADADQQEAKLMALATEDPKMLQIFKDGRDFHQETGDLINGNRKFGKLANLSCNYRISAPSLRRRAFMQHDIVMDLELAQRIVWAFESNYANIPRWWHKSIRESFRRGYTVEFGGRRCALKDRQFVSEQTCVNFPIQGAGASMKLIAISEIKKARYPVQFLLDLHDASFYLMHDDDKKRGLDKELQQFLSNLDYTKYWGFDPEIKLTYSTTSGKNFAELK